jgi:hypothetical protein
VVVPADAQAVALDALANSADLELAGVGVRDDDTLNVGDQAEPPWPCVRVTTTPAGDDRGLRWVTAQELLIEAWDHDEPANQVGPAELRDLLYTALHVVHALPDAAPTAGAPVVTAVQSSVAGAPLPDPATGQPRWLAAVIVTIHPGA